MPVDLAVMAEQEKQGPESSTTNPIDQNEKNKQNAEPKTSHVEFSPPSETGDFSHTMSPMFATAPQTKKFHEIKASIPSNVLDTGVLERGNSSQKFCDGGSKSSPKVDIPCALNNDKSPAHPFEYSRKETRAESSNHNPKTAILPGRNDVALTTQVIRLQTNKTAEAISLPIKRSLPNNERREGADGLCVETQSPRVVAPPTGDVHFKQAKNQESPTNQASDIISPSAKRMKRFDDSSAVSSSNGLGNANAALTGVDIDTRQQGTLSEANAEVSKSPGETIGCADVVVAGCSNEHRVQRVKASELEAGKRSSGASGRNVIHNGDDNELRTTNKSSKASSQSSQGNRSHSIANSQIMKSSGRTEGKSTNLNPDSSRTRSSPNEPNPVVPSTWLPTNFQLRPNFTRRKLEEVVKASGEQHNRQVIHTTTRFPIVFNELSLSAIATWAAHEPPIGTQCTRQTVDAKYRICSSCSDIGHYESECPVLSNADIMRLAVECSDGPSKVPLSICNFNDGGLYDVVVETCGGYLIEQRATEDIDSIRNVEITRPSKTSSIVEVDGFEIKAAKTEIGLMGFDTPQEEERRALQSDSHTKLLVGDTVVWEPAFGDGFDGDQFSGNLCVGFIQEIAGDSALVKVTRTLPPSSESAIPLEIMEVLPEDDSLQWIPLQLLFLNSEEWSL